MEIEAKFELTQIETAQTLATMPELGPYHLGPPETRHLTDQYVDTRQSDCFQQGYECRLRTSEDGTLVTLKSLDSGAGPDSPETFRRDEVEQQLPALTLHPTLWPPGLARDSAERLSRGRPLRPILTLHQERLQRTLFDHSRKIGSLSVDRVRTEQVESAPGEYSIVEFELGPEGTESDLQRVALALLALDGLTPATESKFARGLALLRQEGKESLTSDGGRLYGTQPMSEAGAVVMGRYWKEATRQIEAVREGTDSEAVHDMRVAVRRARSAFALFARWYPKRELRGFRRELRRAGRRLGALRDQEVLLADARAAVTQLRGAELNGLLAHWEERYAVARVSLIDYLDSQDFLRFRQRFEHFLEPLRGDEVLQGATEANRSVPEQGPRVMPELVCDVVPGEIWKRYGDLHAYAPFLAGASMDRLHRLRIAGKRLRYLVESFEDLLAKPSQKVIDPLKELQDVLGAAHDADVATALLAAFRAEHAGPTDRIQPYVEQQRANLLAARAHFEEVWPAVSGEAFRGRLARAVAGLWEDAV